MRGWRWQPVTIVLMLVATGASMIRAEQSRAAPSLQISVAEQSTADSRGTFSPQILDFGIVPQFQTVTKSLFFQNTSGGNLYISHVFGPDRDNYPTSQGFHVASRSACAGHVFSAGDPPCELTISFTAFTTAPATQTVSVQENYPDGERFTATLVANSAPQTTLAVADATGAYRGTADLSATLGGCTDVANRAVTFTLTVGTGRRTITALTNNAGVATVAAASLTIGTGPISTGTYGPTESQGVSASFAGDTGCATANGAATLTVTKRTPIITFGTLVAMAYGEVPVPLPVSSSADDDPDAPQLAVAYTPGAVCGPEAGLMTTMAILGAGQCTITVSQNAGANPNYADAAPVGQTITIAKATPTIAWPSPAAITYGTALSATELGASASVNNTVVAGTYAYTANSAAVTSGTTLPAGSYQLHVTFTPTASDNYTSATQATTLVVNKAPLTITADAATKAYGANVPPFTATYGTLVNGDRRESAISGTLTFSTLATASSSVGQYDLTPGGLTAANYEITFVVGKLTIEQAPLTVTAEDTVRVYRAVDPAFTVRYESFVLGEDHRVLTGDLHCATEALPTSAPGRYAIDCSGQSATNYKIMFLPGTLTIEKAAQTITFAPPAEINVDSAPITLSAAANSGLVVGFAVVLGSPCAIVGAQLTATAAGECTVIASQAGDDNYLAAPAVSRTISIVAAPVPSATPRPSPSPTTPSPTAPPSTSPSPVPAPASHRLTVTTTGNGVAQATKPGPDYLAGARVEIIATPAAGALFIGWTVDGTFQGWHPRLTIEMRADRQVVAAFATHGTFCDATSEAMIQLAARGIIKGYGDGCFGPADQILRAQLAGMIVRAMDWQVAASGPAPFADQGAVDNELWRAVGYLASRGIARGYEDGTYRPLDPVLHIQAIGLITRSMVARGYWAWQPADPALAPEITLDSGHRQEYATFVHYAGAVPGVAPDGHWGGAEGWDQPATRAWFAQVLWQVLAGHWGAPRET